MRQVAVGTALRASGIFRVAEVREHTALLTAPRRGMALEVELGSGRKELGARAEQLLVGDVVRVSEGERRMHVSFRPSDRHHTLFVTNQCNSRCLMCSQPPTPQEDGWLFHEAMEIAALVEDGPEVVGITGGEPTLHPMRLRVLLEFLLARWPETKIEVLTNARRLGDEQTARVILDGLPEGRTRWLVPLYGACDEVHDFVVQAPGAFDETLGGLLNLRMHRQEIQLRTVLVRPVVERLGEWAQFVGQNLPFVSAVAIMGTEPIGFALANEDMALVDTLEFGEALSEAVEQMKAHRLRPVLMNMPLCKLAEGLRPLAAISISDWKNSFEPECERCTLKPACAGFFAWDKTARYRIGIKPILGEVDA